MQAVSGSVRRDEISTLGLVTSQFAYIQSFYHIRIYQQIQDDMTETWIAYAGRNLAVEGSILWLSAVLSFFVQPARERERLILDDDGNMLNSSHQKIAISSTYRPGFSVRWPQRASSMIGAILRCRPTGTGRDLALPNNRKFLRMLEIERLLHCATFAFAICDVASLFLLNII